MKYILLKLAQWIYLRYAKQEVGEHTYTISALTRGGQTVPFEKVNPSKRHSSNNTILYVTVYQDGLLKKVIGRETAKKEATP